MQIVLVIMKHLKKHYKAQKQVIKARLSEFSRVKDKDIFYELAFCILTPQSNAKKCWQCITKLKKEGFPKKNVRLEPILKTKTRFYKNKSKYLALLKKDYPKIRQILKNKNPVIAREHLVNDVKGLGYKEASHFLRNIGYNNLAILDRHILKNLLRLKVIEELPKTLTPKKYFLIEEKFLQFSNRINIPMDELDLLFWCMETGEVFK